MRTGGAALEEKTVITAAIVTYNDCEAAICACRSILAHTKKYPLRLYVIDNASSDSTAQALEQLEGLTVIRQDKNFGFGAAHNRALTLLTGKYHFVINPDIKIQDDVLSQMVDFMEDNPRIAMAMPRIQNDDGTEQKLPKEIPTFKRLFLGRLSPLGGVFRKIRREYIWADREVTEVTDIDFCSGCFFCIRSDIFRRLGGFDQRFFMYLEDADLTLRAKKLGRVVINPAVSVIHLWRRESARRLKYLMIHTASCFKFLSKWKGHTI